MAGDTDVEAQIDEWRSYVHRHREVSAADGDELEDHLRARIEDLLASGLEPDEAFLVAVKRIGGLDELTREFAREHSDRLWKQLVLGVGGERDNDDQRSFLTMIGWAVAAAIAIKVPELFGLSITEDAFYLDNFVLFALVPLAGYLAAARGTGRTALRLVGGLFVLGAVGANVYPVADGAHVQLLTILHLPIALWIVVGLAYTDGDWRFGSRWMDFIRFSGEWFIYMVLLALGGGVLTGLTVGACEAAGLDPETFVTQWLLPCGALGAMIVAAWLVEAKKSVIENMAPVLGLVFTPLFVVALSALVVAIVVTGNGIDVERDALILFDLVLVVVLGLIVYGFSARDPGAPPALFDRLRVALVVTTLAVDLLVLVALAGRITDFGWSANRTAALGENLVLLGNLGWSAWLLVGFVRGRTRFHELEAWQVRYLAVFAAWAWVVVFVFPPVFGFTEGAATLLPMEVGG